MRSSGRRPCWRRAGRLKYPAVCCRGPPPSQRPPTRQGTQRCFAGPRGRVRGHPASRRDCVGGRAPSARTRYPTPRYPAGQHSARRSHAATQRRHPDGRAPCRPWPAATRHARPEYALPAYPVRPSTPVPPGCLPSGQPAARLGQLLSLPHLTQSQPPPPPPPVANTYPPAHLATRRPTLPAPCPILRKNAPPPTRPACLLPSPPLRRAPTPSCAAHQVQCTCIIY